MANERLVLNRHDGVPTLFIEEVQGEPVLHWMVAGYVEPYDLWVIVPLTWSEAEEIIQERPDLDLYLAKRSGQPATVRLGPRAGWRTISVETRLPDAHVDEVWAAQEITGDAGPTPGRVIREYCRA